jgi:regulator of protease activity HflC (stomatin/prohibitin superfamily)
MQMATNEKQLYYQEIEPKALNGMPILILNILLMIAAVVGFIFGLKLVIAETNFTAGITLIVVSAVYFFLLGPFLFFGLKILKPNEALVLTLFGKYYGTLKGEGFFFVNPFVSAFNPTVSSAPAAAPALEQGLTGKHSATLNIPKKESKIISLKTMTLSNDKQKINDELGNPIIIGIVVIWKVVNTAKAAFNVDNYIEFLSIQCDSALRNIVSRYPYDSSNEDSEKSLRGSSLEIAEKLKMEIQSRVEIAGLEILEARITHLAYAPEIAAAMLQRQQASAIIAARQMIVEGAVGMVEMALDKLNEKDIVHLDEERKAAMVSNLLVVLCGDKGAQPIVNSGSIY